MISSRALWNDLRPYRNVLLLSGWWVFLAAVLHYSIDKYNWFRLPPNLFWMLVVAGIFIFSIRFLLRPSKNETSNLKHPLKWVWIIAVLAALLFVIFIPQGNLLLPLLFILLSQAVIISGKITRFVPLMIGGAVSFLFSILSFLLLPLQQQLLGILCVGCGYLIPVHLYFGHRPHKAK